jgi:TRAP-type uncharacterized transport system substrate-binding protein
MATTSPRRLGPGPTATGAALLAWGALSCGASPGPGAGERHDDLVQVFMGSTQATSGVYSFGVAVASAVAKHDPGLVVTVVESSGAYDNARRMKQGIFHWSVSGSPAVYADVRRGTGGFERYGPWEPIRMMFLRNLSVARVYVRADEARTRGIRTWSDLAGRRLGPGMPGTRDMSRLLEVDRLLGTGARFVPGSLGDAVASLKEGRLVGLMKGSPLHSFDASMLECHYRTPLTVVGFTRGEADSVQAVDPLNTFALTSPGSIENLPDVGGFWEMTSPAMALSSSLMPQEVGYRITKAVYEGWKEIEESYAPARGVDPIRDAFANTPPGEGFFYHAGLVQFAREIGIDVPDRFVPPEYRDVR